jgi:hypothetical protein
VPIAAEYNEYPKLTKSYFAHKVVVDIATVFLVRISEIEKE